MKTNIKFFKTIFVILIILSYFSITYAAETNHKNKVIFVLFDISGSINSGERENYYKYFSDKILQEMNFGDTLIIGGITCNSLNEQLESITIEPRKPCEFKGNENEFTKKMKERNHEAKCRKNMDEKKNDIKVKAKQILNKISNCTDIFGALYNTNRVFIDKKNDYDLRLVVMSDGIHISSRYDFSKLNLTEQTIHEIISAEKAKEGTLPDMEGVKVYIWGANSTSSENFIQLENFWKEYIKKCGGKLVDFIKKPIYFN